MSTSGFQRRTLLSLSLTALAGLSGPRAQAATGIFQNGVTVLSSGPAYGYIAGWAKLLMPHLLDGLPPETAATFDAMGGPDGVTVCNAFGARLDPDGSTVMFAPGAALLAWLEGDSRVKYDPGHWLPVLVAATPAVLVGRRPLSLGSAKRKPLRLGATNPIGPELAAFLALDLLGIPAVPVFGQGDGDSLIDALRRRTIDLAFLSGPKLTDCLTAAASAGAQPLFSTGGLGCDGPASRDPLLPNVPSFLEAAAGLGIEVPESDRFAAYQVAATAATLCFATVLPDLVRPTTLAQWRRGAQLISDSLSVAAVAVPQGVRFLTGTCTTNLFAQTLHSAAALDSLRATMQQRYGWRAS